MINKLNKNKKSNTTPIVRVKRGKHVKSGDENGVSKCKVYGLK